MGGVYTCACSTFQVNFWDCPKRFPHTPICIDIDLNVNRLFIGGIRFRIDDGTSVCMTQTHFHNIYFLNQFQEMNDSLVRSCSTDVEVFLSDIDRSVAMSHDVLRRFDKYVWVSEMEDKDWLEAQEKVCFHNGTAPSPTHADVD